MLFVLSPFEAEAELPDGMWAQLVAALKRLVLVLLGLLEPTGQRAIWQVLVQ